MANEILAGAGGTLTLARHSAPPRFSLRARERLSNGLSLERP
jgi:hypothetical protein